MQAALDAMTETNNTSQITRSQISIILPCKNEGHVIGQVLERLRGLYPDAEIIVVDDGSTDNTVDVCNGLDIRLVSHPYSKGNGAAIKSGARQAQGDVLVFMDADGQHRPEDIQLLLERMDEGYDMVVGARDSGSQASLGRLAANSVYNWLSGKMVGHRVDDLTSGFRAVKSDLFKEFIYLLPNGFSYPTTITMAFFRAGYSVSYVPIRVDKREGKSHIRLLHDGVRFFLIIFKVGTLYSPLKLFLPISAGIFSVGLCYYLYTFITTARFTNMSALLMLTSILVFLIGLVSEQVTTLIYQKNEKD